MNRFARLSRATKAFVESKNTTFSDWEQFAISRVECENKKKIIAIEDSGLEHDCVGWNSL
jgi:hypothetical protein